jgi:hypothetical protein
VERFSQIILEISLGLIFGITELRIVGKENLQGRIIVLTLDHGADPFHQRLNFRIAFHLEITSENGFFRISVALKMRFEKDTGRGTNYPCKQCGRNTFRFFRLLRDSPQDPGSLL